MGRKLEDLTGKRFGRLTVQEITDQRPPCGGPQRYWRCLCDCGGEALATAQTLKSGKAWRCHKCKNLSFATDIRRARPAGKLRSTNTSGYTGVSWNKAKSLWEVEMTYRGDRYFLGRYRDINQAAAAYLTAKEHRNYDFAEWYDAAYPGKRK